MLGSNRFQERALVGGKSAIRELNTTSLILCKHKRVVPLSPLEV